MVVLVVGARCRLGRSRIGRSIRPSLCGLVRSELRVKSHHRTARGNRRRGSRALLELMKQRTLLSEYRTLRSELGGKQLNFALRGRQVHAFRGGSAGFVLVALFFVARVGSALFVCVVVVGAFIVLFLILFDVACCGIVQGT